MKKQNNNKELYSKLKCQLFAMAALLPQHLMLSKINNPDLSWDLKTPIYACVFLTICSSVALATGVFKELGKIKKQNNVQEINSVEAEKELN